jgi:hypothetical protein
MPITELDNQQSIQNNEQISAEFPFNSNYMKFVARKFIMSMRVQEAYSC